MARIKGYSDSVQAEFNEFMARRPDLAAAADKLLEVGVRPLDIIFLDLAFPLPRAAAIPAPALAAPPAPPVAVKMLKAGRPELAASIQMMVDAGCGLDNILAFVNSYGPAKAAAPAASPAAGWAEVIAEINQGVASERGIPSRAGAVFGFPPVASSVAAQNWADIVADLNRGVAAQRSTITGAVNLRTAQDQGSAVGATTMAAQNWAEVIAEINRDVAKQAGGKATRNRSFAA